MDNDTKADVAYQSLVVLGRTLQDAHKASQGSTDDLHDLITYVAGTRKVAVTEMATAIGRARNYVDSVVSASNRMRRVPHPAWFKMTGDESGEQLLSALSAARVRQAFFQNRIKEARAARDAAVVEAYASKVLGPTRIAEAVGIDRNHVLRLRAKAGIAPQHRTNIRNQYSPSK